MSSTAEDAIARAKAIAARLSGSAGSHNQNQLQHQQHQQQQQQHQHALDVANAAQAALSSAMGYAPAAEEAPSTSGSSKRKRWGVTPEGDGNAASAAAAPEGAGSNELLPGLEDAAKRLKASSDPIQRRVWVDTAQKPPSHFAQYLNEGNHIQLVLHQLQAADDLKIELKGRGSTNTPPLLGMPEEPLHVHIEGPPDLVAKAEGMVEDLLRQAEAAPLLHDPSSLADRATDALANVMGSQTPGYRPAPVAALIHGTSAAGAGIYGPAETLEEQIGVPNGVVGFIIGRGGENITSMQARTGCKVQIQKEHEMTPGQTQRVITLTASSKEAIDMCRGMIENMVADRIRTTNSNVTMATAMATPVTGSSSQASKLQEAIASGHQLVTVQVPDADVGLIIGKAGSNIKNIQDRSGANIQIPQSADSDNAMIRTVSITHQHAEGAQMAKQMIEDLLNSKAAYPTQSAQISIQVPIPDKDVGMCIGRSGCVIREMQNKTGTKIQIPSMSIPGQTHRIATVAGPADGCNLVKQMIERIILEQSSQSVMSGTAYTNQYGSYGGQPQYGGQQYGGQQQAFGQYEYGQEAVAATGGDYSAEWAAYYAAQAAAAQGGDVAAGSASVATQSSLASVTAAPAAANGQQQGADAYYEQFFRYAYYYGEDAARKYYGAWSPPPGTPNPYGTNPAGITAEPAPAPVQASSSPVTAQHSAPVETAPESNRARDTGVRGVSNLPAWMTKGTS